MISRARRRALVTEFDSTTAATALASTPGRSVVRDERGRKLAPGRVLPKAGAYPHGSLRAAARDVDAIRVLVKGGADLDPADEHGATEAPVLARIRDPRLRDLAERTSERKT